MTMIKNPFRDALFPGLAMIGLALVLIFINPLNQQNLPENFKTPIIAFEFMQNIADVIAFFEVDNVEAYTDKMMLGNKVDYLFMVVYSLFLAFIGIGLYRVSKLKFILVMAILLPMIICLSDVLENINIGIIIQSYQIESIDQELRFLNVFTWIKWTGICSLLFIYASLLIKRGGFSTFIGIVNISAFIVCVLSFFFRGALLEAMASLVSLSFLLYFIGAWRGFGYLED